MNLVLRMIRGPQVGSCRVLQVGQRAIVGTTDACHWVIPDAELRGLRFRFGCSTPGCWVEDLSESPRLLVNGLTAGKARIFDGDVVSLGRCCFVTRVRDRRVQSVAAANIQPAEFRENPPRRFANSAGFRLRMRGLLSSYDSRPTIVPTGSAEISSESWVQFAAQSGTP
ncbi:MAG: FHA domain-containing protein [Planctomycetaceae bacterium]